MILAQALNTSVNEVWRLQTQWSWAPWVTVLFAAAVIAGVVACYRYETSPAGAAYRAALGLLRLTTIVLLLLMLSEAVFSGSRTGKPRLAILLDRSDSMQRTDIPADGTKPTRSEASDAVLLDDEAALLVRLQREYDLELSIVDADTSRVASGSEEIVTHLQEASAEAGESQTGNGASTRLGDAIAGVLDGSAAAPLRGVLVLTDGQVTAGRSLATAAEAARRAGAPLYLVGVGDETAPPEARLSDLVADDTAFVDDLVTFQATLASRGLAGKPIRVELFREGQAKPVATETVTPIEGGGPTPVRLIDRPAKPGEFRYTLRATPPGAEPGSENELAHTLVVRDDQIRVLLAAGYPNYEFRYLKQLLERDETIQVSHHLQESDPEYAEADLTALPRMPLRLSELTEYDTIVLIDLDPSLLPRSLWGELGKYVGERGGGLAMIAGPRSLPAAYRSRSEFAALMPTAIGPSAFGGFNERMGYAVLPTALGAQSAPMQLGDTPPDSERVWRGLPALYWRADVGEPKPAAQVLAVHPTARLDGGAPAPLIVSQFYGAGRVLLHAMDSSYRWRYRVGDVFFARYWVQSLRSLARNKRDQASASLQLAASKRRYEPGEAVRLKLRDERPGVARDQGASVVLQSPGRPDRRIELAAGAGGRFETVLRDLAPGRYRVLLAEAGADPVTTEFEVAAPVGEDAHPEMNREGLQAAAERSRGAFVTLADADRLAEVIPPGRATALESLPPIDLWNRWPILAAITGCLTAEWILRKRKAML